jgi:hypothetical protein
MAAAHLEEQTAADLEDLRREVRRGREDLVAAASGEQWRRSEGLLGCLALPPSLSLAAARRGASLCVCVAWRGGVGGGAAW